MDNGLGILANPEDENLLDIQDQMGGVLVAPGLQSGLVQTPSALNRWMEEAIILDADSIHDCISAIKPDILVVVERYRDEELAERRERRKKQQEEEALRRQKEEEERKKKEEEEAAKRLEEEKKAKDKKPAPPGNGTMAAMLRSTHTPPAPTSR